MLRSGPESAVGEVPGSFAARERAFCSESIRVCAEVTQQQKNRDQTKAFRVGIARFAQLNRFLPAFFIRQERRKTRSFVQTRLTMASQSRGPKICLFPS